MAGRAQEEAAVEADPRSRVPTRLELERLLGLVEELKAEAEAVRGSVAEASIRARIIEAMEGAEALLGELRADGAEHYVDSSIEWDNDVPLDLAAHDSHAAHEYRRAHFYAKGWTDAQPHLAAETRPQGEVFDDRAEAHGRLVASRYDHESLGKAEWTIGMSALAYAPGHGWHLNISEAELDQLVRAVAPHLVTERLDELDAGSTG